MRPLLTILCLLPLLGTAGHRRVRHFNPRDAGGLAVWDARFHTANDGDAVATFASRGASANNATASGTARPTYKTAILNGNPVIRFDGTDDGMTLDSSYTPGTNLYGITICNKVASGDAMTPFTNYAGGSPALAILWTDENIYVGTSDAYDVTASTFSATAFHLYESSSVSNSFSITADGLTLGLTGGAGLPGSNLIIDSIGFRFDNFSKGDVGLISYFSAQPAAPLRGRMRHSAAYSFKLASQ